MVKPYKLDKIQKISRREIKLIQALYELLPATGAREKIHLAIRKTLIKHFGQDIRYYLSSVEKFDSDELRYSLPDTPTIAVLGLTDIKHKILIQIDYKIANLMINKLLGGEEGESHSTKSLTDTEQGVLQYFIMQVLSQIYKSTGSTPRTHFRFERFIFTPEKIRHFINLGDDVYILNLDVFIADHSGYVRFIIPKSLVDEMLQMYGSEFQSGIERLYFGNELKKWGYIKTTMWAEAGNSLLSPVDIKDLEPDDVILFDETELDFSGKDLKGNVVLRLGKSESTISAKLVNSDKKNISCKLGKIVK